jgi:hypothetical protein
MTHRKIGVLVAIGGVLGLGGAARSQVEPLDHYTAYTAKPEDRFIPQVVTLTDQFGTLTATVLKPTLLLNPVNKNNEGIEDPLRHLLCYKNRYSVRLTPRRVEVTNQFGAQTLAVKTPSLLCNPAATNGGLNTQPSNHFQCYKTRPETRLLPPPVVLGDEFQSTSATVLKSKLLCNPVDKNGEGILDPVAHLHCYAIKPAVRVPEQSVTVTDQFRVLESYHARGPKLLCVPSLKTLLP